ncbi:flagellar hook-length control protein FliK [Paenibacillus sp. OV219]|uniref:flagellar hook-length control protein FliK n=1 Tax=Paenibacillus sp. OV219 TaxID=1884377 RepID=UPI0008ACE6FF|nr:flagellar hook-length control protein FliK [Paenibacillus sp. OV219]SEN30979.1 hook-length control protein FliK [Paenibacillus sp. OV219]
MTLSIGQLMKGLLGDSQPVEGKALELKVGQIVRAVLVKMLDDQEGIIQINGTQVQAKLETPLQPGQSTLLQVQPQSMDGTLVLKQVDQQTAAMPEATMKEWLKGAGLPEQKWTAQLVNDLKQSGVPLTRETAGQFKQALAEIPQGADPKTWMNAASLAAKRGLPMTSATISALAQTQSGAPAHVLLEALEKGLAAWSSGTAAAKDGAAGGAAQPPTAGQAAAAKLQALLAEGAALMREAPGARAAAEPATARAAGEAAAGPSARSADAGAGASSAAPSARAGGEAAAGAGAQPAPAPAPQAAAGAMAARSAAAQPAGAQPPASSGAAAPEQPNHAAAAGAPAPSSGGTPTPQPAVPQNWVGQLMKWLGVDHERLLAASATDDQLQTSPKLSTVQPNEAAQETQQPHTNADAAAKEPARVGANSVVIERALQQLQANQLSAPGLAQSQEGEGIKHAASDTMKSALMTLASADDVPQALKDTAQQLVSHITGQQLLLTPEKTGSLFSHVTMFIPMKGADGSQTASVHIQTRRDRKGELDADNCRLLFDLRMNTLGDTVVDVQVVDKIVSVNLWNDHPMTGELAESSRPELTEALQKSGYQLLTLKATPMPNRMAARMNAADGATAATQSNGQEWTAKPYKGVDFRV